MHKCLIRACPLFASAGTGLRSKCVLRKYPSAHFLSFSFLTSQHFTYTHTHTHMPTGTHKHNICFITHAPLWLANNAVSHFFFSLHTHTLRIANILPALPLFLLSLTHTQNYTLCTVYGTAAKGASIHLYAHYNAHIVVKSSWIRSWADKRLTVPQVPPDKPL